jgi:hypothetical protein
MRFLSSLNAGEMISLSEQWTGPLKVVFLSIPELAALLPRVQEDHDALLAARAGSSAEAMLRTLSEQATGLDVRHDHLQRALHYGLLSAREIHLGFEGLDSTLAVQISAAHQRLLPDGLEVNNASYEAEAGNAAQMVQLAGSELGPLLMQLPVASGVSALDLVQAIGKVGAQLGAVEHNKSVTAAAASQETVAPAEVRRRMRAWADTLETALGALSRSKAPADVVTSIRVPVLDAIEKARTRVLAQRNAAEKKKNPPIAAAPEETVPPKG